MNIYESYIDTLLHDFFSAIRLVRRGGNHIKTNDKSIAMNHQIIKFADAETDKNVSNTKSSYYFYPNQ